MNQTEIARLLTVASAVDNRTVSDEQVIVWHRALQHLPYAAAQEALIRHFRDSTEYLLPAHISAGVRRIAAEREREARVRRQIEPPKPITFDRDRFEAETAEAIAFYAANPDRKFADAERPA